MDNLDRMKTIEQFIADCCSSSSIYYRGKFPSVKYLCGLGKVVFFDRSRMLDYCEMIIPDYDASIDEALIARLMSESTVVKGCESHAYQGCHYCLSFNLLTLDI